MMVTRNTFIAILISAIFLSLATAESETAETLKTVWTSKIVEESHDKIVSQLLENGMSDQDAEQIVIDFASAVANCVFEAARQSSELRSVDFDELLIDLDPMDLKSLFRDEAEFNELGDPCFLTALENTGVTIN